jgi:hypothetical protein
MLETPISIPIWIDSINLKKKIAEPCRRETKLSETLKKENNSDSILLAACRIHSNT